MTADPRALLDILRRPGSTPEERERALAGLSGFVEEALCVRESLMQTLERATHELETKVGELSLLRRLSDVFAVDFERRELPGHVLEALRDEQGADDAALWIADGDELHWRAGVGRGEHIAARHPALDCVQLGDGLLGQIGTRHEGLVVNDALLESRCRDADPFFKQGSFCVFPLLSVGRLIGVLWVGSVERFAYPAEKMRILTLAASQVAQGLAGAELCHRHLSFSEDLSDLVSEHTRALEEKSHELLRYQASWAGFLERLQLGGTAELLDPMPASQRLRTALHSLRALAAARSEWRATLTTAAQLVQSFCDDYERYVDAAARHSVPVVDDAGDAQAA